MRNKTKGTFKKYGTWLGLIAELNPTARSSTGIRGVYRMWDGSYQARINVDKKEIILICTKDLDKAIKARKEGEEKYYKPIIDLAKENGDFLDD